MTRQLVTIVLLSLTIARIRELAKLWRHITGNVGYNGGQVADYFV